MEVEELVRPPRNVFLSGAFCQVPLSCFPNDYFAFPCLHSHSSPVGKEWPISQMRNSRLTESVCTTAAGGHVLVKMQIPISSLTPRPWRMGCGNQGPGLGVLSSLSKELRCQESGKQKQEPWALQFGECALALLFAQLG